MAEKAIKVELSEEDRKILLAQKKALSDILKPEKKSKGIGAMAAELILSGKNTSITGALGSATKQKATESLQEKTKQLKEKFDPLNIINSMFGGGGFGSVMTAAIGKNMGRNEEDIRKFANLDDAEKSTSPENNDPTQMPSGEGGEKSDTMLTEMLKYVIKISEDIRGLKDSSKNQEDLFKDQLILDGKQLNLEEEQLDAANEARYEAEFAKKKPTPVGADGKDKKETKEEKGFLASLLAFGSALGMIVGGPFKAFASILSFALSPLRALGKMLGGPLLRGLSALGAVALPAAKAIGAKALEYGGKAVTAATPYVKAAGAKALEYGGKAVEVGKAVGGKALAYATEKAPTLVAGAKAIGSKAVDIGKNIGSKVAEKAPSIIAGVKTMGSSALAGAKSLGSKAMQSVGLKAAATGAKGAAAAGAGAVGKAGVISLIKKAIAKRVPKAVGSALGKSIPFLGAAIGVGFALSRLMDGDVVGAGLEAVSGIGSVATAIPATIALVAKDIYQDVYGIKPESDPEFGERMGLIQSETEAAVKAEFTGKVGEEKKTDGDKKEGDKKGDASGETKVPEAPELKDDASAETKVPERDPLDTLNNGYTKKMKDEYTATSIANRRDKTRKENETLFAHPSDNDGGGLKPKSAPSQVSNSMDGGGGDAVEPLPEESSGTDDLDAEWNTDNYPSMFYSAQKFGQEDPDNAKKYNIYQRQLSEEYALKRATSYGRVVPSQDDYDTTGVKAYKDSLLKFRKELTASGAGMFGDAPTAESATTATPPAAASSAFAYSATPEEDSNGYASPVEPEAVEPLSADAFQTGALTVKGGVSAQAPTQESAQPTTGERMTKQSNENTMAKTEAMTGGNNSNTSIVSAPKITNSTSVTNAPINVRNNENTFVRNQDKVSAF
jgi:hypothetical protein